MAASSGHRSATGTVTGIPSTSSCARSPGDVVCCSPVPEMARSMDYFYSDLRETANGPGASKWEDVRVQPRVIGEADTPQVRRPARQT
jgi:hypothetical protein